MHIKEITIGATISTSAYNNIQPSITLDDVEDIEEARSYAMKYIGELSQKYAEEGKALMPKNTSAKTAQVVDKSVTIVKLTDIFKQTINFDRINHVYFNDNKEEYLSGSKYAERFSKPFNAEMIAQKMADKYGIPAADILEAWKHKAEVSAGLGTAIHAALEMREKFRELAIAVDKPYDTHDHPVIKKAVDSFYESHGKEKALSEVLIVDHKRNMAGCVDRLVITGKNKCKITDFKTNAVLDKKKLDVYWQQLSFYSSIMQAHGWEVEGLEIYHWDGDWTTYKSEVLEVKL